MKLKPVTKGELNITGKYFQFVRPGSMEILKAPSLIGGHLIYPRENHDKVQANRKVARQGNVGKRDRRESGDNA